MVAGWNSSPRSRQAFGCGSRSSATPDATPILLIMGANASGPAWPERFVTTLAAPHRVIRYDHRDTGRSTWAFDDCPYALTDLATDAVTVLDTVGVDRAHVVGMSMGGVLVQLLLLDHPDRLLTTTVLCTSALGTSAPDAEPSADPDDPQPPNLPGPDPQLLALWEQFTEPRDRESEIAWRVAHWRVLNGTVLPFDTAEFRELEERVTAHAGTHRNPAAHARAAQGGLDRGDELAKVSTPTLVIEAPEDPANPPPHAMHLAGLIPGSRLVTIPGMGHALSAPVLPPLADAVLAHTATYAPFKITERPKGSI